MVLPSSNVGVIKLAFIGKTPGTDDSEDKTFAVRMKGGYNLIFKEWCLQNGHEDYIALWDYERNDFGPDEVQCHSKKRVYLKCPRGLHDSNSIICENLIFRKKCVCNACNSFGQRIIDLRGDAFLKQIWGQNNDCSPFDYPRSSKKKIWLRCLSNQEHGEYQIACNTYTASPGLRPGCPMCHVRGINGRAAICDSLATKIPVAMEHWSEKNTLDPYGVTQFSHRIAWWKCHCGRHNDFERCISESVRYNFRCPTCSLLSKTSNLQNKVSDYLVSLGYTVLHEYECNMLPERKWVKNNRYMPYDNEVVELKLIVEVNGRQHYDERSWHDLQGKRNGTSGTYEFKMQKKRDMFKMWYAITHGYSFLAIPYTAENNDQYIELINDKIKEITAKESVTTTA